MYIWRLEWEGGEGYPKSRCSSKGGCLNLVLWIGPKCRQGGEGVKNPTNFADVICTWPLTGVGLRRMEGQRDSGGRHGRDSGMAVVVGREGGTDSIWCLKSGLSGRKWGIWYPDNFPQIIRILGLQIWANSINIWLKYDPKTLSNNLLKSFFIHMKEIHISNWFQFSDCSSSLISFFTHMKEVHLEIWFTSPDLGNSLK